MQSGGIGFGEGGEVGKSCESNAMEYFHFQQSNTLLLFWEILKTSETRNTA